MPFQLTPPVAEADSTHPVEDDDWPGLLPGLDGDDPADWADRLDADDYLAATISEDDRAWLATHTGPTGKPAESGFGNGKPAHGQDPTDPPTESRSQTGNSPAPIGVLPADRCHCGGVLTSEDDD